MVYLDFVVESGGVGQKYGQAGSSGGGGGGLRIGKYILIIQMIGISLKKPVYRQKKDFYSSLKESHIKHEDFEHANTVWNHFSCQTLGESSDLYLKSTCFC